MRRIVFAAILISALHPVWAAQKTITDDFIQLLKRNAEEKARGTNDPTKFILEVTKLADQGDASAQFLVGVVALAGRNDVAEKYLVTSAKMGCVGAEAGLGVLLASKKQVAESVAHLRSAAEGGDAMAQVGIAGMYQRGDNGFEKSLPKAYVWLRLAERQTFSNSSLLVIRDALQKAQANMSSEEVVRAEAELSGMSTKIVKVDYSFCGQLNIDTSRDQSIPYYFRN